MNYNNDLGIIDTLLTIDTTAAPPLGGTTGLLNILGTGGIAIPTGTTAQQPPVAAGIIRYNTTIGIFEGYNGTAAWVPFDKQGTVTSVGITGSTGLVVGSSPITTSGTITLTLGSELQGLAGLAATGLVTRTGAGAYTEVSVTGTTNNIVVTNGSGVAGNPTINLATAGTPVTASFLKITTDAFGRVTATTAPIAADITTALGYTPVNKIGDTMTGNLLMSGGATVTGVPTCVNSTDVANKAYVDGTTSSLDVHQAVEFTTTPTNAYTVTYANGTAGVAATLTNAGTLTAFGIDGNTPGVYDRVLIKNQATASQNGIYTVTTVGNGTTAWVLTRATDADNHIVGQVHAGMFVFVAAGATLSSTGWVETTLGTGAFGATIIGTDSQIFTQFSGAGTFLAATPIVLTGNTFSINGLNGYGAANTLVSMNTAGTALAYKTVTAGTGISVTPTAGDLTIANTGVTSVSVSGGTTGITTSGGPITTTGTITLAGTLNIANGGTGLTATPTNGQIDIGNGTTFTRSTITAGTGVSIVNGIGTITVNNTGVTYVNASGGTTGLLFTGDPVTTTGTLTLSGTLVTANGGTGLTTIGAASKILGVNVGATALEYKTITSGTGISVVNAAGAITINNTGVTSVGISTPSFLSVTNSPITTSGTIALALTSQTANTVFAGPNGSAGTPTFRILTYTDIPLKLYAESPSSPHAPVATGVNTIAEGSGSSQTIWGGQSFSNDQFATAGDSQKGTYILRAITTNATATTLYLDTTGTQSLILANNSLWSFSIFVAARRTDATGGGSGYTFEGVIRKDTTAGSTTFVGTPSKTILGETNSAWDIVLTANTTTGGLQLAATGEAAKTIRWVATVSTTEVTN